MHPGFKAKLMTEGRYVRSESGGTIWLQIGDESSLKEFEQKIQEFFSKEPRAALASPIKGQVCVVDSPKQQKYVRARVMRLFNSQAGRQATVQHVDHGITELVSVFNLFLCPSNFLHVPLFACRCFLCGVDLSLLTTQSTRSRTDAEWKAEANQAFLRLIHGCSLSVEVKDKDTNGDCQVLLYATSSSGQESVCVNDCLQTALCTSNSELKQGSMPVPRLPHFAETRTQKIRDLQHVSPIDIETRSATPKTCEQKKPGITSHGQSVSETSEALAQILGISGQSKQMDGEAAAGDDTSSNSNLTHKLIIRDGVFLSGPPFPSVCASLTGAPFGSAIVDVLKANLFPGPTAIQAHCWWSILRGRDVVGVSRSNTGKTLAYLLPLLSTTHDSSLYRDLPQGIGPFAIILSPYWEKASCVHDEIVKYWHHRDRKGSQKFLLYGGGTELTQSVLLLNGCDILVATPHSLLRALKHGHTSLSRLCHIVFDDADILVKVFSQQVCELMSTFASVLRGGRGRGKSAAGSGLASSCQKLVFSSSWTSGVSSLVSAYLANPITIITSRFDAMIYCNVSQSVSQCASRDLVSHLAMLLQSERVQQHNHVVIFSGNSDDIDVICKELDGVTGRVVGYSWEMTQQQIYDINTEWNQLTHGTLVCTDGAIQSVDISKCSLCIHIDFPHSKSLFSERLSCLKDSACRGQSCESVLLVTERCLRKSLEIIDLLKKFGSSVPPWLKENGKRVLMLREHEKKHLPLSPELLSYGWRDDCSMEYRQKVWKEQDSVHSDCLSAVPLSGLIRVLVSHVESVCCYWGRVLNHQYDDGAAGQSVQSKFVTLSVSLGQWFSKAKNRRRMNSSGTRMRCAVQVGDGVFYRAEVVSASGDETNPIFQCRLIDVGCLETVDKFHIFSLPDELQDFPPQAVKIFLCQVRPIDRDIKWTVEAHEFACHLMKGKELQGKIVLRLRGCVWLDPLVEKRRLQGVNVMDTVMNVKQELIKAGMAESNPQHIAILKQVAAVALPDQHKEEMLWQENMDDAVAMLDHLTLLEQGYQDVVVSAVVHPELFFVQSIEWLGRLHKLEVDINSSLPPRDPQLISKLHVGSYCLAQFSIDSKWYRARILERHSSEYYVMFVDHGEDEWLQVTHIRPIPPHMLSFPVQAVECCLSAIVPCDDDWSPDAADLLCRLSDSKTLVLEVRGVSSASMTAGLRYDVDLFDTTGDDDINLAEQLIDAGVAFFSTTMTNLQELRIEDAKNHYEHWSQKIADFCSVIQRSQSAPERVEAALLMRHTIIQAIDRESIQRCNGLRSILQLLSQPVSDEVLEHVVFSLAWLLKHKMNSEAALRSGVIKKLTHLLVHTERLFVRQRIIWCFQNLLQVEGVTDSLRDEGTIKQICSLMTSISSPELLVSVCSLLSLLTKDNLRNSNAIRNEGGLKVVVRLIGKDTDSSVKEQAVRCLEVLAQNARNRDSVRLNGGIPRLCQQLEVSQSKQFIELALSAMHFLVSNNRANALAAVQADLLQAIDKIEATAGSALLVLCSQLRTKISDQTKSISDSPLHRQRQQVQSHSHKASSTKPTTNARPIAVQRSSDMSVSKPSVRLTPFVRWWQTKHSVVLSIQLRGVSDRQIKLTKNRIEFRSIVKGVEYELDVELFSNVIPEKSREHVTGSQLSLILAKQEDDQIWPRLLAMTERVVQIGIDFDHLDDDDSALPSVDECESLERTSHLSDMKDKSSLLCLPPEEVTREESSSSSDEEEEKGTADEWIRF